MDMQTQTDHNHETMNVVDPRAQQLLDRMSEGSPYGAMDNIVINPGKIVDVVVNGVSGQVAIYEEGDYIIGYSLGGSLDFFHTAHDPERSHAKALLEAIGAEGFGTPLKMKPIHTDNVAMNKEIEGEISADGAIVSPDEENPAHPVYLAPADCTGFCFVEPGSGVYGIFHAGRAGIGYNIAEIFTKQFVGEVQRKGGDIGNIKIILPPHIFGHEYPHKNNKFITDSDGNRNKWDETYITQINGVYYPEIGPAAIAQIREVLPGIQITVSGLSTFQGAGISHSLELSRDPKNTKRNIVFVAKKRKV
jgi:copper oxidase (laccase) domain-containing protein